MFRQSEELRLRVAGRDAIGVINAATMSAPKPFLATAMGGIVVVICTFIVVAGGFVLLLVNSAQH